VAQDKEQRQALMAAQPPVLTLSAVTATSAKAAIRRQHSGAAPAAAKDADAGSSHADAGSSHADAALQQMVPHGSAQPDNESTESSASAKRRRQRRREQSDASKEGNSAAQDYLDKVEGGFFQISICRVSSAAAGTTDASSAALPLAAGSKGKRQAAGNRAGTARHQAGKQGDHSGQQRVVKVRACLSDMADVELGELLPGCQYIIKARAGGWCKPGLRRRCAMGGAASISSSGCWCVRAAESAMHGWQPS
jgi:hypothetical protein